MTTQPLSALTMLLSRHTRRRAFISLLGGAVAAAWPLTARAQQMAKVYRIGMLETTSAAQNAANLAAFRQGLQQLGYVEGHNLTIEYRSADGRAERFPELARELVALKIEVIVTRGTPAAQAAKNVTSTVPVVMAAIGSPVQTGVVAGLAHPGGNITGLSAIVSDLGQRIIDLAMRHRLPAIYASREFVDVGGLITYGVSYPDLYHRAATYVDKILKGAKPGDLPVEQPTKLELVINRKTAEVLGLDVPATLLGRADEVIE